MDGVGRELVLLAPAFRNAGNAVSQPLGGVSHKPREVGANDREQLVGYSEVGTQPATSSIAPTLPGTPLGRLRLRRSPGFGEPLPLPPSSLLEAR